MQGLDTSALGCIQILKKIKNQLLLATVRSKLTVRQEIEKKENTNVELDTYDVKIKTVTREVRDEAISTMRKSLGIL